MEQVRRQHLIHDIDDFPYGHVTGGFRRLAQWIPELTQHRFPITAPACNRIVRFHDAQLSAIASQEQHLGDRVEL